MNAANDNNTATLIHLSALSQYIVPFGNFIFPIIIWSSAKDKSGYIDQQGKQCINFQLSIFIYTLVLALIAIPVLIIMVLKNTSFDNADFIIGKFHHENVPVMAVTAVTAVLLIILAKAAEFFLIIYAAVKTSSGEDFKYPLTIRFLGNSNNNVGIKNQSEEMTGSERQSE